MRGCYDTDAMFGGFGCPVPQDRIYDHALTPDEVKREHDTERITVNKTTHRIRFENETESSVDIVIEPKN